MSSDFDFFENRHRKIGAHHEKNGNRKIPDSAAKRYRGNQKKEFERADFPYSGLTCCSNSYVRSMRYPVAYCSEKIFSCTRQRSRLILSAYAVCLYALKIDLFNRSLCLYQKTVNRKILAA